MGCIYTKSPQFLNIVDLFPNLGENNIKSIIEDYQTYNNTNDYPPAVGSIFTLSDVKGKLDNMSPFNDGAFVTLLESRTNDTYNGKLNELAELYFNYRSTLEDVTPVLDNIDLENFSAFLTNKDALYFDVALRKVRDRLGDVTVDKYIETLNNEDNIDFYQMDIKSREGIDLIRKYEQENDIKLLDKFNMPKLYDSSVGPYILTPSGYKMFMDPTTALLLDPNVSDSIINHVLVDYFKDGTNVDIINYFREGVTNLLENNVVSRMREIESITLNAIVEKNPELENEGSQLADLLNEELFESEEYIELYNAEPIYKILKDNPNMWELLEDRLKIVLRNSYKFEINTETIADTLDNQREDIEVNEEDKIVTESTIGEQFDRTTDLINPLYGIDVNVQKLFIGVPINEDGVAKASNTIPGVILYNNPRDIESKVLNILANTMRPLGTTNIPNSELQSTEIQDTYQLMYNKLEKYVTDNSDNTLGFVLDKLDSMEEASTENDIKEQEYLDFKKQFVSSFSLFTKNFTVSVVGFKGISGPKSMNNKNYSKNKIALTISNFDSLSDMKGSITSNLVNKLPDSAFRVDKKGRKTFDPTLLDEAAKHIIDYHSSKKSNIDTAAVRMALNEALNIQLTDAEVDAIVDVKLTKLPSVAELYDKNALGKDNGKNTLAKILDDYRSTRDSEVRRIKMEVLTKKNADNNLFGTIIDVLNKNRMSKQQNVFVLGKDKMYGYTDPSYISMILQDVKNGNKDFLLGYNGTHNAVADYLLGNDLEKTGKYSNADNDLAHRLNSISLLDDKAVKEEEESTISNTEASLLDKIVIGFLRFTNSDNSFLRENESVNTKLTDVYHLPLAADGNMSLAITGIDRGTNNTLLKTQHYYSIEDDTIIHNDTLMQALAKKKITQVFERMRRAEVLIEDYVNIDNLDKSELNDKLIQAGIQAPDNMSLKDKRNLLAQTYALRNFQVGYHYNTKKNLADPSVRLTYEDFLNGTYHRGGYLNDILRENVSDTFTSLGNEELIDSLPFILYKSDKLSSLAEVKYPQMNEEMGALLGLLKTDTNAFTVSNAISNHPVFSELSELIIDELNYVVEAEYDKISDTVVTVDAEGKETTISQIVFDTMLGASTANDTNRPNAIKASWSNYILNTMVYNMEFMEFFTGGFDKYKQPKVKSDKEGNLDTDSLVLNMVDPAKRFPAAMKETERLVNADTESRLVDVIGYSGDVTTVNKNSHSVMATVKDAELVSMYLDLIKKGHNGITNYISNIADGMSFISPSFYKMRRMAVKNGWTSKDEAIFNSLMDKKTVLTKEIFEWLKEDGNYLGGADKPFIFGLIDNKFNYKGDEIDSETFHDNNPIMGKTAFYALFPALVKGSKANEMLKAMESQGVDILAFESAVKSNMVYSTDLVKKTSDNKYDSLLEFNDNPFDYSKDKFRLNPFIIPNDIIGKQQDIPNKGSYEGDAPKQTIKNLLGNIDLLSDEKDYLYEGSSYTGAEIVTMINDLGGDIIQTQVKRFAKNVYGNELGEFTGVLNDSKIRDMVISQMDPIKDADDIKMLSDKDIPITALVGSTQRILPLITKLMDKTVAQVNTNKGSMVQIANIGFNEYSGRVDDAMIKLSDDMELKPPVPITIKDLSKSDRLLLSETEELNDNDVVYFTPEGLPTLNKEEGKMRIAKAKMIMPFKALNLGISWEQFNHLMSTGKIDKEIFRNILSYRIPNQAISSNDSVEIVGILPPYHGDSAFVYHDITTKTGSDFDIDKLYLMLPSFEINRKNILTGESEEHIRMLKEAGFMNPSIAEYMDIDGYTGTSIINELSEIQELNELFYNEGIINNKGRSITTKPFYELIRLKDNILELLDGGFDFIHNQDGRADAIVDVLDDIVGAQLAKEAFFNMSIEEKVGEALELGYEVSKLIREESIVGIRYSVGNTMKAKQNKFIKMYNSILESHKTYPDLITPLDSDAVLGTKYYKDDIINKLKWEKYVANHTGKLLRELSEEDIKPLKEQYDNETRLRVLQQFSPISRAMVKKDMDDSKRLVATMANHMSDIPYSQLFMQKLKETLLDYKNEYDNSVSLDGLYSKAILIAKADQKISQINQTMIVSWLMNAAVDAAKDNYIIEGNFNTYTAPAAMFMTRLGLSPNQVFSILMSDTVRQITKSNTFNNSIISDIKRNDDNIDNLTMDAIELIARMKESDTTFSDIFTKDNIMFEDKEVMDGFTMRSALRGLWAIVYTSGRAMNTALKLGKPDSTGTGHNYGTFIANYNNLALVKYDDAFHGVVDKLIGFSSMSEQEKYTMLSGYQTENLDGYTMLGHTHNAQMFTRQLLGDFTLEGSEGYINLVNDVSAALGEKLSVKEDRISDIHNAIYSYMVGLALDPFVESGLNLPRTNESLLEIKKYYYNKIKLNNIDGNTQLSRDLLFNDATYSITLGTMNIQDSAIASYKAELSNAESVDFNITKDILMYSLLDNGLRPTKDSIYKILPNSTMIMSGLGNKLNNIREALVDGNYTNSFLLNGVPNRISIKDILKSIAMKNPKDYRFVKTLYKSTVNSNEVNMVGGITKTKTNLYGFKAAESQRITHNGLMKITLTDDNKSRIYNHTGAPSLFINYYDSVNKLSYLGYLEAHMQPSESLAGTEIAVYRLEVYDKFETAYRVSSVDFNMDIQPIIDNVKPYSPYRLLMSNFVKDDFRQIEPANNILAELYESRENNSTFVITDELLADKDALMQALIDNDLVGKVADLFGTTEKAVLNYSQGITPDIIKQLLECN